MRDAGILGLVEKRKCRGCERQVSFPWQELRLAECVFVLGRHAADSELELATDEDQKLNSWRTSVNTNL